MDALFAIAFGGAAGGIAAKAALRNFCPESICSLNVKPILPQDVPTVTHTITSTSTHPSAIVSTITTPAVSVITKWRTETSIRPTFSTITEPVWLTSTETATATKTTTVSKTVTHTSTQSSWSTLSETISETNHQSLWQSFTTKTSILTSHLYATTITEPKVETTTTTKTNTRFIDKPRTTRVMFTKWSTTTETRTETTTEKPEPTILSKESIKALYREAYQRDNNSNWGFWQALEAIFTGKNECWKDTVVQSCLYVVVILITVGVAFHLFQIDAEDDDEADNAPDDGNGTDRDGDDNENDGQSPPVNQSVQYQEQNTQTDSSRCKSSTCTLQVCTNSAEYESEREAFDREVCKAFLSHNSEHPYEWVRLNISRLRNAFQGVTDCLDRQALATKICDAIETDAQARLAKSLRLVPCKKHASAIAVRQKSLASEAKQLRVQVTKPNLLGRPEAFVLNYELSRLEQLARMADEFLKHAVTCRDKCSTAVRVPVSAPRQLFTLSTQEVTAAQAPAEIATTGNEAVPSSPSPPVVIDLTNSDKDNDDLAHNLPVVPAPLVVSHTKVQKTSTHLDHNAYRSPTYSASSSSTSRSSRGQGSAAGSVVGPATARQGSGDFQWGLMMGQLSISSPSKPFSSPRSENVSVPSAQRGGKIENVPSSSTDIAGATESKRTDKAGETSSNDIPQEEPHSTPHQQSPITFSEVPSVAAPSHSVREDIVQPTGATSLLKVDGNDDLDSVFEGSVSELTSPVPEHSKGTAAKSPAHTIDFSLDMEATRWPHSFGTGGYAFNGRGATELCRIRFPEGGDIIPNSGHPFDSALESARDSLAQQRQELPAVTIEDFLNDFDCNGYRYVRSGRVQRMNSSTLDDDQIADLIFLFGIRHHLHLSLGIVGQAHGYAADFHRIISPLAKVSPTNAELVIWLHKRTTAEFGRPVHRWHGLGYKPQLAANPAIAVGAVPSGDVSTEHASTESQAAAATQSTINTVTSSEPSTVQDQESQQPNVSKNTGEHHVGAVKAESGPISSSWAQQGAHEPVTSLGSAALIKCLPGTLALHTIEDDAEVLFLGCFAEERYRILATSNRGFFCALDAARQSLAAQHPDLPHVSVDEFVRVFHSPEYQVVRSSRNEKNENFLQDEQVADLVYLFGVDHGLHLSTGIVAGRSDRPQDRIFTVLTPLGENAPKPKDPHHVVWLHHEMYILPNQILPDDETQISQVEDVDWHTLGLPRPRQILGVSHWSGISPIGAVDSSPATNAPAIQELPVGSINSQHAPIDSTAPMLSHGAGHTVDLHSTVVAQHDPDHQQQRLVPSATSPFSSQQDQNQQSQNAQQQTQQQHVPNLPSDFYPIDTDMIEVPDTVGTPPDLGPSLNLPAGPSGSDFGHSNTNILGSGQLNAMPVPSQVDSQVEEEMDNSVQAVEAVEQEYKDPPFPKNVPDSYALEELPDATPLDSRSAPVLSAVNPFNNCDIQPSFADSGHEYRVEADNDVMDISAVSADTEAQGTDSATISIGNVSMNHQDHTEAHSEAQPDCNSALTEQCENNDAQLLPYAVQPSQLQQASRSALQLNLAPSMPIAPSTSQNIVSDPPSTTLESITRSFQSTAPAFDPTFVPSSTEAAMPPKGPLKPEGPARSDVVATSRPGAWLVPSIPSNVASPQDQKFPASTCDVEQAPPESPALADDEESSDSTFSEAETVQVDEEVKNKARERLDDLQELLAKCRIMNKDVGAADIEACLDRIEKHLDRATDDSKAANWDCKLFEPEIDLIRRRLQPPYVNLRIMDAMLRCRDLEKAKTVDEAARKLTERFQAIHVHIHEWHDLLERFENAIFWGEGAPLETEVNDMENRMEDELEQALDDLDKLEEIDTDQVVEAYTATLETKTEEELETERKADALTMKMDAMAAYNQAETFVVLYPPEAAAKEDEEKEKEEEMAAAAADDDMVVDETTPERDARKRLNRMMSMMVANQNAAQEQARRQSADLVFDRKDDLKHERRRDLKIREDMAMGAVSAGSGVGGIGEGELDLHSDESSTRKGDNEVDEEMEEWEDAHKDAHEEQQEKEEEEEEEEKEKEEEELDELERMVQEEENSHLGR